jgi:glyoxylase-like metal-dependent hydrolase (beta-lactamase superfamily II)
LEAFLHYPFETEPQVGDGSAVEVAPGVLWLRMPVFAPLNWINVWALEDGDGWTLVDTGLATDETVAAWRAAFGDVLGGRPVKRVICTHMHPDNCGLAGWICGEFGVRLWMSGLEYLTCRILAADTGRAAPEDGVRFYRAAGWDEAALDDYRSRFGSFGRMIRPLPDSYRRIADGEWLAIGKHRWRVVVGSGHSPEHACLHCPELELLISGDQVLPKISSNVSVYPTEPDADPLDNWLRSLAKIKDEIPDDVLVLPSHNSPFLDLHHRLDQLTRGHLLALDRLRERLDEPKRAVDIFGVLFARQISPALLTMATGEAVAHLNHLEARKLIGRDIDENGVAWWRRTSA